MIWLDFETRSECDLKLHGAYNYAAHPSTQVLCASYAIDDEEVRTGPLPDLGAHQIRAHNAGFERLILKYCLGLDLPIERFYCTATQARANCMPGSLGDVGRFTGGAMRKDHRGAALIRKMCTPPFSHTPALMAQLVAYCEQDVRTMRAVSRNLRELTPDELADYHTNEHINDRGVMVDRPLAQAALRYAAAEKRDVEAEIMGLTGVAAARSPLLREWVLERVPSEALETMVVNGKYCMDKRVRALLLDNPEVSSDVLDVVQAVDDMSASSVSKFERLAGLAGPDDRVRGAFVFAGGAATGRASSYGAQVHNFARQTTKAPDEVRRKMVAGEPLTPAHGHKVMDILRGMLRPALIPAAGTNFIVADWSAIEARLNPWLSCDGEAVLDAFRNGEDIYVREARKIFKLDDEVTPEQRQIGKVAVLSCGYGGGAKAFASMGRNYGVFVEPTRAAKLVELWRHANSWAVKYWSALEVAYTNALTHPGEDFLAGRVTYHFDGRHLWYALPSGRILCYPFARREGDSVSYAKAARKPAADATEWPRAKLWKGLACENICQAAANDVLRHSLRQLDDVVLHVHDEIVVECADDRTEEIRRVMCTPPPWAEGLPLDVSIKTMRRYGK